jgi:hypothetical protein
MLYYNDDNHEFTAGDRLIHSVGCSTESLFKIINPEKL